MGMIGARQYASHRLEAPVRSRRVSGSAFRQHATGARLCRPAALKESRSLVTHAGESGVNVPDRWRVVKRFVTGAVSAKGRDRGASSAHGEARTERRRRSVDGVWGTEGSPHPWPVGGPLFCPAVHAAAPHNAAMNISLFLGGRSPPKPSRGVGGGGNPVSASPCVRARPSRGRGRGATRFPHTPLREPMFTLGNMLAKRPFPERRGSARFGDQV